MILSIALNFLLEIEMEILKNRLVLILIICGVTLCLAFLIITNAFYIAPSFSNIAIGIGVLTPMPAYMGLYIYSREIKEQKRGLSNIIIRVVFILVVSSIGTSIAAILRAMDLIN
jgi:hypothetical protein